MTIISFCIPCFNSEAYMKKCIDSILVCKEDVEIIIVNDGSTDSTLKIASEYAIKYPNTIRVVDKENGGHGSCLNVGIKEAKGLYYKVVDSDDWVDSYALSTLIDTIKTNLNNKEDIDLYITNFIYDHALDNTYRVMDFKKMLEPNKALSWNKVKTFHRHHLLLMHSLLYKTCVLRESGLILPEHTFYVDNIFAYTPLSYVKTIYYLDVNLYHYFIGRSDQSVNIKNFSNRYLQQIRVMKEMINAYSFEEIKKKTKYLRKYLWHCLNVIMVNTVFFTCCKDSKERRIALKELKQYIKTKDRKLYNKYKFQSYVSLLMPLPWHLRGFIMKRGYSFVCRKVKLG